MPAPLRSDVFTGYPRTVGRSSSRSVPVCAAAGEKKQDVRRSEKLPGGDPKGFARRIEACALSGCIFSARGGEGW